MALTNLQKQSLMLTADQWIRRNGPPIVASVSSLARYLFDYVRADNRQAFSNYQNIARQAVRAATVAQEMQDNPNAAILTLPTYPGLTQENRKYTYRIVVAAKNADGEELWSTAVSVESSSPLTGQEAQNIATQMVVQQMQVPTSPPTASYWPQQIVNYETFIMLAGQR
jgi:hypothetical protein